MLFESMLIVIFDSQKNYATIYHYNNAINITKHFAEQIFKNIDQKSTWILNPFLNVHSKYEIILVWKGCMFTYLLPLHQQCDTLFTCYVCDRTFPSSEELTQHQSTHNKEDKPFKCAHCQECFRTFSEVRGGLHKFLYFTLYFY